MSLAGPRLDRPSAIGDEGRPRATSLGIATLVVVALAGVSGYVLEWLSLLPTVATVVGLTAAGAALLEREGFFDLLAGHAVFFSFGSLLALLVVGAPLSSSSGLAVSGFAIALLGIALSWADVGNYAGLKGATRGAGRTYGSVLVATVVLWILLSAAFVVWFLLDALTEGTRPAPSAVGFGFVLACAATVVWLALRVVPFRQLAPRDRRPTIERWHRIASRAAAIAALGGMGLGGATVVVWASGWLDLVFDAVPGLAAALTLLSSELLVGPIAAVGGVSLVVGAVATFLRLATRRFDAPSARRVAAAIVGTALAVVATLMLFYVISLLVLGGLPYAVIPAMIVVAVFVAPLALIGAGASLVVGAGLGVLPDRAAGPTIAAAGLVVAAIGLRHGPPALVFACVAGAVLVWDVSTFGLGVTAELGHLPETRRLELFHGLVGTGVAIAAVLVAVGFDLLRTALLAGVGGTGALLLVVLGVLILLIPLRG